MQQVNIAIATSGLAVILAGLISARLESLPFSKPLIALSIGVIAGPEILAWLTPQDWPHADTIMKEAARMALAISVFGIALRTPVQDYRRLRKPCALLLTAGMGVMWLVSAGLGWALLGLSPLLALLLGAIISPTDPVVASSIVTGRLSEHSLPNHLRSSLSLESGANDGLAYLIVLLPLLLLQEGSPSAAMEKWLLEALIIGVVLALVLGAVIGYLAARALHHAERIGWMERNSLLGLSVALSLAVVAFAKVLGSDGILAAFAAGTAFNFGIDRNEEFEEQRVQETIGELFNLPVFVIFGAMLPWAAWAGLGGAGWGFAAAILVLRRPLALLVTGPWLGAGLQRRDIAFLGWFGPVGVAAIYYALHVRAQTENPMFWHVTSLVVFTSIIAHGITSGPGLTAYARAEQRTTELRTL